MFQRPESWITNDVPLSTPGLDDTRLFMSLTAGAGTRTLLLSSLPSLTQELTASCCKNLLLVLEALHIGLAINSWSLSFDYQMSIAWNRMPGAGLSLLFILLEI